MPTDPAARRRRSIRLPGFDYAGPGAYFITLCTHHREHLFGEIVNREMVLNDLGQIAHQQWLHLPGRFNHVELDAFVVMPNHFHGIVIIDPPVHVGAGLAPARDIQPHQPHTGQPRGLPLQKTLGDIVGAYKSLVSMGCLKIYQSRNETMGKIWQRNYYEHIIRDEKSYLEIAQYIFDNPAHWETDSENINHP